MTLITLQGNEVLLIDGDVATGAECCCEPCVCPPNIDACPETFDITFTGFGTFDPACNQDFTFTISKNDLNNDGIVDGWQGGIANFISIVLYCDNGRWLLQIGADNYPPNCPVLAAVVVDLGCVCPDTGTFNVIDEFDNETTVVVV